MINSTKNFIISFTVLLLMCCPDNICGQEEKTSVLELEANLTYDILNIHQGSQAKHNGKNLFLGMEQLMVSINPFKKIDNGFKMFFNVINTQGARPSEDYIGDLQVISNIEAGYYSGLFEAYLEHHYARHSVMIGLHDLNATFLYTDAALNFVNSSFGIMPSVSCNVSCSIYPLSALGINYLYTHDTWALKLAFYDGNPGSMQHNNMNLNPSLSKQDGIFSIAEFQYNIKGNNDTQIKGGAYWHSADFTTGVDDFSYKNNYGAYALIAHNIKFHKEWPNKFQLFIKGGLNTPQRNFISSFIGGGLVINDLLHLFQQDQIGLAIARANISNTIMSNEIEFYNNETAYELFYSMEFLNHFKLQPSIQYITHPGGLMTNNDAFVSLLRFQVSL